MTAEDRSQMASLALTARRGKMPGVHRDCTSCSCCVQAGNDLGHSFDDALRCLLCGRGWHDVQARPSACEGFRRLQARVARR